jgi:mRNA degradation ribonuclease J1/J2
MSNTERQAEALKILRAIPPDFIARHHGEADDAALIAAREVGASDMRFASQLLNKGSAQGMTAGEIVRKLSGGE